MVGTAPVADSMPGGNMPIIICMSGNPSRLGGRWRAVAAEGGWGRPPRPPPPPGTEGPAARGGIGGACIRYWWPGCPPGWPNTSCGDRDRSQPRSESDRDRVGLSCRVRWIESITQLRKQLRTTFIMNVVIYNDKCKNINLRYKMLDLIQKPYSHSPHQKKIR